ncbi:MAG: hypothetical protein AB1650_04350 [Candidatus Omnitrophota bacterium]
MNTMSKFTISSALLLIFISFDSGPCAAASWGRSHEITEALNRHECKQSSMGWSDLCEVGSYRPRQTTVTDALDRYETSSKKSRVTSGRVQVPSAPAEAPVSSSGVLLPASQVSVPRVSAAEIPSGTTLVAKNQPAVVRTTDLLVDPGEAVVSPDTVQTEAAEKPDTLAARYFDPDNPQNEFEMGTEVFDYSYREEGFMKLDGMMYGVFLNYQHRYRENPAINSAKEFFRSGGNINLLKFDARVSGGNDIKYRSEGTGSLEDEKHYAFETRLMAGYEFPWKTRSRVITPYAGLGYRYLLDDNGGRRSTTGHWAYDRESHYFYIPMGVQAEHVFISGWKTRLNLEFDWFLGGRQYSHLEDVPGYTQTLYNKQEKGYGLRGSWRLAREGEHVEFFIEPFVRYWSIQNSQPGYSTDTAGIEPRNRTEEYGARLGVKF